MKLHHFLLFITLFLTVSMLVMTGCEYDGPTATYYQKHAQTNTPVITGLNPSEAGAGINYITITGEEFSAETRNNKVYFDGIEAEVVDGSTTSLTIRRPNCTGDSTTVKVVSYSALEFAMYGPYKVKQVYSSYGEFAGSSALGAIAFDKAGNLYVANKPSSLPSSVFKITPGGQKTLVSDSLVALITDMKISPDGKLILLSRNRLIRQMDPATSNVAQWVNLSAGKSVAFGDFDANGYFYAGGTRTDLMVIAPDLKFKAAGVYTGASDILAVHVFNGYVYLAVKAPSGQTPAVAIWRHSIGAGGTLGDKELILDWASTGVYASATIRSFALSADGILYIGTNATHPIMSFDPSSNGSQDILYKGILSSSADQLAWGNGNYLFMILGGTNTDLIRIDMGKSGASN